MNLGHKTLAALRERRSATHAPFVHEEVGNGIHLKIEVEDGDKFGVLLRSITVTADRPHEQPLKAMLAAQAAEVEKRFIYLLESFKLIETDQDAGTAQLRSGAPYREADTLHYYEILLRGGHTLLFARYQKQGKNNGRELEPCYYTDQVLARLCDDAVAVLRPGA